MHEAIKTGTWPNAKNCLKQEKGTKRTLFLLDENKNYITEVSKDLYYERDRYLYLGTNSIYNAPNSMFSKDYNNYFGR